MWVAPSANGLRPVFYLGYKKPARRRIALAAFTVATCDLPPRAIGDRAVWRITYQSGSSLVDSIAYGSVPSGFKEEKPAPALASGCYMAFDGDRGSVRFSILDGGVLVQDVDVKK